MLEEQAGSMQQELRTCQADLAAARAEALGLYEKMRCALVPSLVHSCLMLQGHMQV